VRAKISEGTLSNVIVCLFSSFLHKKIKLVNLVSHSPMINLTYQRQNPSGSNPIRLRNCDTSTKSRRRNDQQKNNTNCDGDSGYSEESFATTTNSSYK